VSPRATWAPNLAFALLLTLFATLFVTHAWVVDDAYITFRTVDNFVNGLGLRWNPDERVQVYTHPLWMFVCSTVYAFSHEVFFSVLALSFATSMVALLWTARCLDRQISAGAKVLFLGLLLSSKAFMDFSSSGLENPLTHLLIAAFFVRFLFPERPWAQAQPRQVGLLMALAALGFVNREDTILFFAPACAFVAFAQLRARTRSVVRTLLPIAVGAMPALGWLAFALWYYGSAVPNTAYAKLIGAHITRFERLDVGVAYFLNSLSMDVATLPLCALAVLLALAHSWRKGTAPMLCAAGGILLYFLYVLADGAVGTHMSGRFFSGAAFLSLLLLAVLVQKRPGRLALLGFSLLVLVGSARSPLWVCTSLYDGTHPLGASVIDTREYAQREGSTWLDVTGHMRTLRHPAYLAGLRFRASLERVHVGGPDRTYVAMVGYAGYAAGPGKHIIDVLGLTDPLIARIPISRSRRWKPGHFYRTLPTGYVESVRRKTNLIVDPDLHRFYDALLQVTRGPLTSLARLNVIWQLNTGQYEHYLRGYASRNGLR